MRTFLERISSRKFLVVLAVEVAGVVALFCPGVEGEAEAMAVKIAGLVCMVLAAFGYATVEGKIDAAKKDPPMGFHQKKE